MQFHNHLVLHVIECIGSRSGPLTWAQQHMWPKVNLQDNFRRMDLLIEVHTESTVAQTYALSCLTKLVQTNPTLRTRILTDANGNIYQRIYDSIAIPIHVVDLSHKVASLTGVWSELPDVEAFHLVQAVIASWNGDILMVGMRINHALTDQWGAGLLQDKLAEMLAVNREGCNPSAKTVHAASRSSVDLASFESSSGGRRVRALSFQYADAQFRNAPQTMFPHPNLEPERPQYWDVELWSERLDAAILDISHERQTPLSIPIISAFAAIMAARASLPAALIYLVCNNRIDRAWRNFTGSMVQDVPLCIPVLYPEFSKMMDLTSELVFLTYRNGRYDPLALNHQICEVGLQRGMRLDRAPHAAMVSVHSHTHPHPTVGRSNALHGMNGRPANAHKSLLSAKPRAETEHLTFYLDVVIGIGGTTLSARVDTAVVSLAETRAILRGLETLLCEQSRSDLEMRVISDLCPGIGRSMGESVELIGTSLVSPKQCRSLLLSCAGVADASIYLDASVSPGLIASVRMAKSGLHVRQLHESVVSKIPPHSLAIAPELYRLHSPASASSDLREWEKARPVAEGDGRIRGPSALGGAPERVGEARHDS